MCPPYLDEEIRFVATIEGREEFCSLCNKGKDESCDKYCDDVSVSGVSRVE